MMLLRLLLAALLLVAAPPAWPADPAQTIPKGDSAVIPFRIQLPAGTYEHLTGYTITLTVKNSGAGPFTATIRVDDTWCDIAIPRQALVTAGVYAAAITADNGTNRYTQTLTITVKDHA